MSDQGKMSIDRIEASYKIPYDCPYHNTPCWTPLFDINEPTKIACVMHHVCDIVTNES